MVTFTGFEPAEVSTGKGGCAGTFTIYRSRRALLAKDGNTIQLPSGNGEGESSNMNVLGECHGINPLVSTRFRFPEGSK